MHLLALSPIVEKLDRKAVADVFKSNVHGALT